MKAVLFDLDGTICDTVPLCLASFKKALEPLVGRELSEKEIKATFGVSEQGTVMALCPQSYDEGIKAFFDHYKAMHDMCPAPFDGIVEVLGYLKSRDVFIGLITGKGKESCNISLEYYGIKDYFRVIRTGSPKKTVKHQHIKDIMIEHDLDASDVIYIGDTVGDIKECVKAGVRIISVAYSSDANEKEIIKENPYKIVYDVNELKTYMKENY